jgi:hypothetical protein
MSPSDEPQSLKQETCPGEMSIPSVMRAVQVERPAFKISVLDFFIQLKPEAIYNYTKSYSTRSRFG